MSQPPPSLRIPRFDPRVLAELVDLYSTALGAQAGQWRRTLERLGTGRYDLGAAAEDLGEAAERGLLLSADLVSLYSRSLVLPRGDAGRAREPRRGGRRRSPSTPAEPESEPEFEENPEPESAAPPAPPVRAAPGLAPPPPPRRAKARRKAERFLLRTLAAGERHSREVLRLAGDEGISQSTLQRAKKRLGVRSRREGFGPESRVLWELPEHT